MCQTSSFLPTFKRSVCWPCLGLFQTTSSIAAIICVHLSRRLARFVHPVVTVTTGQWPTPVSGTGQNVERSNAHVTPTGSQVLWACFHAGYRWHSAQIDWHYMYHSSATNVHTSGTSFWRQHEVHRTVAQTCLLVCSYVPRRLIVCRLKPATHHKPLQNYHKLHSLGVSQLAGWN